MGWASIRVDAANGLAISAQTAAKSSTISKWQAAFPTRSPASAAACASRRGRFLWLHKAGGNAMTDHPTPETLFERGLPIRREVLGAAYVDASMDNANDFMMAFQHATTELAWGYAWARPGLDRKTRSLLNLAMLTALKAPHELKLHVKGAITNGVTVEEIKETLLHAAAYCGIPAALEAFKAANEVLVAEGHIPAKKAAK
jgi:4-carboxymuconolactone decarboxylase